MSKKTDVYGWDENKSEEGRIANMALDRMAKLQKPTEAEEGDKSAESGYKDFSGMKEK